MPYDKDFTTTVNWNDKIYQLDKNGCCNDRRSQYTVQKGTTLINNKILSRKELNNKKYIM